MTMPIPNYIPLRSLMIKNEMCPLQTADMHGLLFVLQAGAEESKREGGGHNTPICDEL